MIVGSVSALVLIYFSPTVQIDILGHTTALFPLKTPGLVSIPLSFITAIVVSLATNDKHAVDRFSLVKRQIHLGEFVVKHRELAHGENIVTQHPQMVPTSEIGVQTPPEETIDEGAKA